MKKVIDIIMKANKGRKENEIKSKKNGVCV